MQFSDSMSSSSSAASPPPSRGGGCPVAVNASTPLASAVRAFHATYSSELRGTYDDDAQRLYGENSSLRIQLAAGLSRGGSPVSDAAVGHHGGERAHDGDPRMPSTQQAPPFFAKASAAHSAAQSFRGEDSAAERDVRAFRMTPSSSSSTFSASSASSLTPEQPEGKRPTVSSIVGKRLQLRRRSASETPFVASTTSPPMSCAPAARRSGSSQSSLSESSASDVVFHRLPLPHATLAVSSSSAAAPPAVSVPPPAHHHDPLCAGMTATSPNITVPAASLLHRSAVEKSTMAASASTLTDTERTCTAGASFVTSSASPMTPNPAVSYTRTSKSPAAVWSAAAAVLPASQLPTSPSPVSSLPSDPLLPHIPTAAAGHANAVYSSFEAASGEEVDEHDLNSSAASRAAQAALDAEEQLHGHEGPSDSSPVLTALTEHSFSVTPLLTPVPKKASASPRPMQVHACKGEMDTSTIVFNLDEGKDCDDSMAGMLARSSVDLVHTTPSEKRQLLSREERNDLDGAVANSSDDAGAVSHMAGWRRQPLPPPTPSTVTKKSPSSSSAMRRAVESDDTTSTRSGGSPPCTNLTVEQRSTPVMAQGAATALATSVDAAQAVEHYTASALPPDRSSSSGIDSLVFISGKNAGDPAHKTRSRADDTHALSLQRQRAMECGGRPEEAAVAEHVGSAMMPSTIATEGGAVRVRGSGSEGVAAAASVPGLEQHPPHHAVKTLSTYQMNDETKTRAADPAVLTTGGETSASRASAVLMPPSPSQPRAASMLDNSSFSSHSCGDATAAVAAALAGQSDRSRSGQALLAAERDAAAQPSKSGVVRRALVMRCMQDSSTSSSLSSSSSRSISGHRKEPRQALVNPGTRTASGEQTSVEKKGGSNDRPVSPSSSALCVDAMCAKDPSATHACALQYTEALDGADVGENEEAEETEEDGTPPIKWDGAQDQESNPLLLQEAGRWDAVLEEMELVDCTVVSRVYQRPMPLGRTASHSDGEDAMENMGSEEDDELCLFKVVSLFPIAADHSERWERRTRVQKRLLALAEEMRATQRALDEAGLTAAEAELGSSASQHVGASVKAATKGEERAGDRRDDTGDVFAERRRRTTCAGVSEVYVDSRCRLIAQLEAVPYMVPLRHLVAASSGTGLRENEVLALIRTVVCKAATMHNAGFVHGALHAGNVLLSSYDGDAVLTQPCGLMSQSSWLPTDLSVISVARANAMAPYLSEVWGARRLQVGGATSTRLGPPQRPDTAELITYHNLAALGWLDDSDARKAGGSADRRDSAELCMAGTAYTPTAADDLHAVGMIAFLIYVGVPPFQMASLWAVVERLRALGTAYGTAMQSSSSSSSAAARQEARRLVEEFCFGTCRRGAGANDCHRHGDEGASPSSGAPLQRHGVARFQPDFEQALQSFIVDCVEASCSAATLEQESGTPYRSGAAPHVYANAQELLTRHPLFRRFALPAHAGQDDEEEHENGGGARSSGDKESDQSVDDKMRDTVHRVAYPAFCTWARAREDCGSAPHLSRLHSNALFTARCTALCECVSATVSSHDDERSESWNAAQDGEPWSSLSVISPHVAGALQAWQFPFLSAEAGTSCLNDRETGTCTCTVASAEAAAAIRRRQWRSDTHAVTDAARLRCLPSLVRPTASAAPTGRAAAGDGDDGADGDVSATTLAQQEEDVLEAQLFSGEQRQFDGDFAHQPHLHALTLAGKQESAFSLSRDFVLSRVLPVADTLVLQHLTDCTVTVLAPFRYVVLDGLQRCEVRLGPCESCVLRDVHDCPLIAVAALQLSGNNVTETHLSWSRQGSGRPLLKCSRGITASLYGLMYEGLVEDYSRVGLALEHAACFVAAADVNSDSGEADGAVTFRGPAPACPRAVELLATTATSASRSQREMGLCLAPEAPYDLALLLSNTRYVHSGRRSGGLQSPRIPSPDVFHFFGELAEKDVVVCDVRGDTRNGDARPVVFLVGALGDIVIERCSHCTILVSGTPSNLQASQCHDCQLIFMARESVVEDCARVECVALVTEYLLVRQCDAVRVRPLFLDCPFSDEVLRRVVGGSVGGDEEEIVVGAYEAGRLDELNAVLRGVGQGVLVEASENVIIEDIGYYYHRSCRAGDGEREDQEGGADGDGFSVLSVAYASMQSPTAAASSSGNASRFMAEAAQSLAEHLSLPCYLEPLQRYGGGERAAVSHAGRPTVSFHDLLNCSVLRLRGSLCPLESQASPTSGDSTVELADICVERVHGGVLYVEDAVHTLRLRHCVGPLDIVVCAAARVFMEACVGVQLRTACVDFRATDCVHCHVALHVNNPPQYQRCRSVQTSALNITARDFSALLSAAGVDLATNLYDEPLLLTEEWKPTVAAGSSGALLEGRRVHALHGGCVDTPTGPHSTADMCAVLLSSVPREQLHPRQGGPRDSRLRVQPDQVPRIMAVLRQPVMVVAPLPGLCASPNETPFLEELEARVLVWAKQPLSVSREEAVAIALYALADLAEVYASVTEWVEATDAVQPTEAPKRVAAFGGSLNSDAPPHLLSTRAPPSLPATSSASSTASNVPGLALDAVQQRLPPTERVLLQQAEQPRTKDGECAAQDASAAPSSSPSAGDASGAGIPAPAKPMLVEAGVVEIGPGTEGFVEEVAIHSAPAPPLSLLLTCYTDPPPAPKNDGAQTSPAEGPHADPVALHRPSQSESLPMRAQHGRLAAAGLPTLPCTAASAFASSAAGLDGAASGVEDDTSVNSSVAAPPLPPGPAYALNPTNVGASSTMDVFYNTQRDAASVVTGTAGPLMEEEGGAYSLTARTLDDEGVGFTSASPWPDGIRSPVVTGGRRALKWAMGSGDNHEGARSGRQASPVAETIDVLGAQAQAQWPSSLERSPHVMESEERSSRDGDELLVATTAVCTKELQEVFLKEEVEPHYARNAAHSSLRTSTSSVAEYPWRGVMSHENSAEYVAGGSDNGTGESTVPQTNFLHVSQDSSARRLELNSQAAMETLVMAMGSEEGGSFSTVQRGVLEPPASGRAVVPKTEPLGRISPEVMAMHEVDANVKEVLRQVEQARQLFARNQRSWESSAGGGLEARVRAAVAKLTALKAAHAEAA
ncbi:hypothetical protein, conserved [Leishmania donovani]|uniref:Tubulin binding cofactor C, putative n=1 Tax=Leishmania donovani TaxID=5661 RepID=E9BE53_LEIDO|nr:hypothetical protein, conserved [Leishmania donovani]AYU78156.1 Tubulin binding cofactor C, putative [Leishmania donovani]CBZ33529.1 hypothetical protein, conserved [Leishmania donovani]